MHHTVRNILFRIFTYFLWISGWWSLRLLKYFFLFTERIVSGLDGDWQAQQLYETLIPVWLAIQTSAQFTIPSVTSLELCSTYGHTTNWTTLMGGSSAFGERDAGNSCVLPQPAFTTNYTSHWRLRICSSIHKCKRISLCVKWNSKGNGFTAERITFDTYKTVSGTRINVPQKRHQDDCN